MSLLSYLSGALNRAGAFLETKTATSLAQAFARGDDLDNIAGGKITRPMAQSVWVMRAIKRIAEPIASVHLDFFADARNGAAEITDARLAAFWDAPALDRSGPMGRADFLEATVGWLKLHGECFWLLGDDWLTTRAVRGPMLIARPDRMRPALDGSTLIGWSFTDAGGGRHDLVREQVIHLKFWNPYDDLRGLAEYAAAQIATEGDYLAGIFSRNLMRNNGDTGLVVVAKGGMPTDAQQEQITASLRAKKNAAVRGDFRPIFLTGDVAIEDPKIQTPDAAFAATRLENRHEIALAFGVPPSMFDVKASYSEGASSDRYMLIADTCMPLANGKIADAIETVSARIAGRRVFAQFDFDEHDVMQQARRARIASVPQLFAIGTPPEQINVALDLGLTGWPGWEKSYLPFNLQTPGETLALPASDTAPQLPAPAADSTLQTMLRALDAQTPLAQMQRALEDAPPAIALGARTPAGRDPERVRLWERHMRSRATAVKRARVKFGKVLMAARSEVLAKMYATGKRAAKAAAADFLFSLQGFEASLTAELRKANAESLQEAGKALFAEVGRDDVFTMPPAKALRFLESRKNLMTDVADDVFAKIKGELEAGIQAGESTAGLAKRVKTAFNGIDDARALTVAQTETAAAYSAARQEALEQAGIQWKEWLTSGLDNVRATHLEAEGQTVRTGEAFRVGAVHLTGPGTPLTEADNDPGEIINCHCVAIAALSGTDAPQP